MYKMQFVLNKKDDAVYIKDRAGIALKIEDDQVDIEIQLSVDTMDRLFDEYKEKVGEIKYYELLEQKEELERKNEYLNNQIEQYEQYNDERMAKYFESQFY